MMLLKHNGGQNEMNVNCEGWLFGSSSANYFCPRLHSLCFIYQTVWNEQLALRCNQDSIRWSG